jgi:ribosomal protection tetracycline resistance protein
LSYRTLNLGILAHVDAGKTTLTERLLFAAGAIRVVGRVDAGTTQTDSLTLERQRGITIKSAVVSFALDETTTVNLIDTPGHPDFIAEVERVLGVLDGAVLLLSAVEGVQAQTRLLMRALQRLGVPTLLFVNKTDRAAADVRRVMREIADRLTPAAIPLARIGDPVIADFRRVALDGALMFPGSSAATLAEHDEAILRAYVNEENGVSDAALRAALVEQSAGGVVHAVLFGSALNGEGVDDLRLAIRDLLPTADGDPTGPMSGTVFKVERGRAGEKIAYVRMFSGALRTRDRVRLGQTEQKVTAISVFGRDGAASSESVSAGEIAKVWGLSTARIGDAVGAQWGSAAERQFAPAALETIVVPRRASDLGRLRAVLGELSEQDPLIDVRQDDTRQELFISLYGDVQKEVIEATLQAEYDLAVEFRETTTVCVERPISVGEAVEVLAADTNPFLAGIGLRVEPGASGREIEFSLEVELGSMPVAFFRAVEDTVRDTLRQGLHGWEVIDCRVTMTHAAYLPRQSHAHQRFNKNFSSTGADFRGLTPMVVMQALAAAQTRVCEPIDHFTLELPPDSIGVVLPALVGTGARPETTHTEGSVCTIEGEIPAGEIHKLRLQLPGLTRGEGLLESVFARYRPIKNSPPSRPRLGPSPLDRQEFLASYSTQR